MSISMNFVNKGPSSSRPAAAELDCESAALLRATIQPAFTGAASWAGLSDILRHKGYKLRFQQGALCVTDRQTGERVCGLRFLGLDFAELVQRLGRPIVIARGNHAGDLIPVRPTANRA